MTYIYCSCVEVLLPVAGGSHTGLNQQSSEDAAVGLLPCTTGSRTHLPPQEDSVSGSRSLVELFRDTSLKQIFTEKHLVHLWNIQFD